MQTVSDVRIFREQIDTVFRQFPLLLLLEILSGALLFNLVVLTTPDYSPWAFVWLVAVITFGAIRVFVERLFHDSDWDENFRQRKIFIYSSIFVSSLVWSNTWLLLPAGFIEAPRAALLLWPCAMLATAAVTLSVLKRLFFCFAVPIVILQIVAISVVGNSLALRYSFGILFFFGFVSIIAYRAHKFLNQAIDLQLSNEALQQSLESDREVLRQQEETILASIRRERELLEDKQRSDKMLEMANEEKLLLLDAVGEGIFGTNTQGQITFVNHMALSLLGYRESEVLGQDALALLCHIGLDQLGVVSTRTAISQFFNRHEPISSNRGSFCEKSGKVLPVNYSCHPILKEEQFVGAVVSFFDISEQITMESRLLRSQKMEVIGRITGGVAHDFNNLLTVVQGNLQFLRKRLRQKLSEGELEDELRLIEKIMSASKSGAELNNRLLSYSREQALKTSPENLNAILVDMNRFVGRVLGEDIDFELDLCETDYLVTVDRTQFENVILNLCMNSRDAMPDGGRVVMRTRVVELTEDSGNLSDPAADTCIELSISDTGTGIPPEIQEKIFDPFFTTKKDGAGSGFGLSTAYGFLQQSGGNISVESTPGEGTTFYIHVPVAPGAQLQEQEKIVEAPLKQGFSGTVLVVEDDDKVRDVACLSLEDAGYQVLTADNGHAGLEKFKQYPGIDLVFSDIIMPGGITGIEMARKIMQHSPGMKLLLATGYTQKSLKDSIADLQIMCISKPYDVAELPKLIDSLIHDAA